MLSWGNGSNERANDIPGVVQNGMLVCSNVHKDNTQHDNKKMHGW